MSAIDSLSDKPRLVIPEDDATHQARTENLKSSVDSTTGLDDGQVGQMARLKAMDEESIARTADEQRRRGVHALHVTKAPTDAPAAPVANKEAVKLSDLDPYIRA